MKRIVSIALVIFFAIRALHAQIPNAGFEQWSGGEPSGWFTSNVQGVVVPVTQSSTARTGTSALRGQVMSYMGFTYTALVQSGTNAAGFPVSQRYGSLTGYYQFSPVSGDQLGIVVLMTRTGSAVGAGAVTITSAASSYTQFTIPVVYTSGQTPDTCIIQISIGGPPAGTGVHLNTFMLIDDLAFGTVTPVEENTPTLPIQFSLQQNYPNPFNPSTTIDFSLPHAGFTSLKVYNSLGSIVATLVDGPMSAGTHSIQWNAAEVPTGVYYYQLQSNGLFETRKLVLLK